LNSGKLIIHDTKEDDIDEAEKLMALTIALEPYNEFISCGIVKSKKANAQEYTFHMSNGGSVDEVFAEKTKELFLEDNLELDLLKKEQQNQK
jgi:hypothetical protein